MNVESRTGSSVVVVGGYGPTSITQFVSALPERVGFSVLVSVPDQAGLAAALRPHTKLPIAELGDGTRLEPGRIYIVPPGMDVTQKQGALHLAPAAVPGVQLDRVLRSVSDAVGRDACAVILSGVGQDGAIGLKRVKEAGGVTFAEEPSDGPLGEMPRAAIATGLVDLIAEPAGIVGAVCRVGMADEVVGHVDDPAGAPSSDASDTLRDILTLVRVRSGHDFGAYKRATLYRRVARRMQVCQVDSIQDYHHHLRDRPGELAHLLRDFLISVTNFFRDPEAYEALSLHVLSKLFANRSPDDPIRLWVAGCATGEEAYSLGILLLEHAARVSSPPRIQIFATDIDEEALGEARMGRYPDTIAGDVSPERLERHFVREGAGYRINAELRELVLFSPHNLLRDPPFSRLDLVSCRNLLIYLNREAQNRVLSMFHFGLRPEGFMFLGSSESAESSALFATLDAKARIYGRRLAATPFGFDPTFTARPSRSTPISVSPPLPLAIERTASLGEVHHRLVERYAPPSILVSGELEVLHVSEHAGKYLEIPGGEPTRQLMRLIHPALRLDLRTAIHAARQAGAGFDTRRVVFEDKGVQHSIELRVRALDLAEIGPQAVLVFLDESASAPAADVPITSMRDAGALMEPVVRVIEDELQRTREQLRSTIEQYETSLEELKASNEELQAINEELRSASEELETSKEELQSVNEELTTLNHEMKVKVDEVSRANSDLQNLMSSTDIGVVFLDRDLNIKRFTPRALDLFNMIPSDIGRPLAHVTHKLDANDLSDLALRVLQQLRPVERDVQSREGRRFLVRVLPYRSLEDRIEGVVLTFIDVSDLRDAVDARRRSEAARETSEARLRAALRGAPMMAFSVDDRGEMTWGYAFGQEVPPGPIEALPMFNPETAAKVLRDVRETQRVNRSRRLEIDLQVQGMTRLFEVRIEPTGIAEASVVGFDITASREGEAALRETDRRKDVFLATLSHELRNPLTPLKIAIDVAKLAKGDQTKLESSLAIMDRQVTQLSQLVDELLDLSRITQGKIDLVRVPIEPGALIEAALESARSLIDEQRHTISVDLPSARVFGDAARLTQVFVNLLTNAAKYTPPGGTIEVRGEIDDARHTIKIHVSDDGVGIPREMLARIFDVFVQSPQEIGRARGGLGIGLSLVKQLVELHGGTVRATSDGENRGSRLTVELPLAAPPPTKTA